MSRYLIVNADDFGHTKGVSEGILRAYREGIVTSTSVMINKPAAADGLRLALGVASDLGFGLHLTLTSGRPVLAAESIPDLVQASGSFHRPEELMMALAGIDLSQVERELRAQVELFIQIAGRAPDHLDSHHHITYKSPVLLSVMLQLAQELDMPIRNPFQRNDDQAEAAMGEKQAVIRSEDMLRRSQVLMPDCFLEHFYAKQATLGNLLNMLFDLPDGVCELMCHPAIVDDALRDSSTYSERRADELAVLVHPSVRDLIEAGGIELVSFGSLGKAKEVTT